MIDSLADSFAQSPDFNSPRGSILGLLNAILGLGCIVATPFISVVGDRWGRRMGIFLGAVIMLIGGVIQGACVHSKKPETLSVNIHLTNSTLQFPCS